MPKISSGDSEQEFEQEQFEEETSQGKEQPELQEELKTKKVKNKKSQLRKFKLLRGVHCASHPITGKSVVYYPGDIVESTADLASRLGADKFSPVG